MQDWMESKGFTPLYFFVAIPEKIIPMNLRPVFDWMKRQIFR